MKQICLNCGSEFDSDRDKKFCNARCNKTYWMRQKRAKDRGEAPGECILNEGVECYDHKCRNCGWNPKVARKRLEAIVGCKG